MFGRKPNFPIYGCLVDGGLTSGQPVDLRSEPCSTTSGEARSGSGADASLSAPEPAFSTPDREAARDQALADLRGLAVHMQQTLSPVFKLRVSKDMEAQVKEWGRRRGIRSEAETLRQLIAAGLGARR